MLSDESHFCWKIVVYHLEHSGQKFMYYINEFLWIQIIQVHSVPSAQGICVFLEKKKKKKKDNKNMVICYLRYHLRYPKWQEEYKNMGLFWGVNTSQKKMFNYYYE